MAVRISFVFLLLAMLSEPLQAQHVSLMGGTWIHSEDDPDYQHPGGVIHLTMLVQFLADGRLVIRTGTASPYISGEFVTIWRYRITSPASYSEIEVDYEPKQICGGGICGPASPPAMFPLGTKGDCDFQFDGPSVVTINCSGQGDITYTRH